MPNEDGDRRSANQIGVVCSWRTSARPVSRNLTTPPSLPGLASRRTNNASLGVMKSPVNGRARCPTTRGCLATTVRNHRSMVNLSRLIRRKHAFDAKFLGGDRLRGSDGRDHRKIVQDLTVLHEANWNDRHEIQGHG